MADKKTKLYIGTTYEIENKVLTIGAIERNIDKAIKEYKGKQVLLSVSKKIMDLCKVNIDYDAEGFGVYKMQVEKTLQNNQFELTELGE